MGQAVHGPMEGEGAFRAKIGAGFTSFKAVRFPVEGLPKTGKTGSGAATAI